jgi:uncharacterized membrane protein YoaK (UPF0700 family)
MANTSVAARPRVAITLAAIGGFVDAVGFLVLFGMFTAHLSGNTARLGVELGQGNAGLALTYAVPIVGFFLGVVFGITYLGHHGRGSRRLGPLLGMELTLLVVYLGLGTALRDAGDLTARSSAYYVLAVVAVVAMGLQTAALRHVCGVLVHTTFITAMVTNLAEELVATARHDPDAPRRARVHGGLVGAYIVGAVGGSALESAWALWALAVPIGVLAVLIATVGRDVAT